MASEDNKSNNNQDQTKVNLRSFNILSNIENPNKLSPIFSHKVRKNSTLTAPQPSPYRNIQTVSGPNKVIPNKFFKNNNNKKKRNFYNGLKKRSWAMRKLKKSLSKKEKPQTPHNTTQFIVNTVYYPTDPYIYDFHSNRFGSDIKNHSMLGSMMSNNCFFN